MARDTEVAVLTLEVLKDIRQDIRGMRGEMSEMRGEMSEMRGEMSEMRGDIRTLTSRFDNFLEFGGGHHRELEARVERLEERVFRSEP